MLAKKRKNGQRVCMSLCLSVRSRISQNHDVQFLLNFMNMLPVAVARLFSDNSAISNQNKFICQQITEYICYVLPVL